MTVRVHMKGLLQRLWRRLTRRTETVLAPAKLGQPATPEPISPPPLLQPTPRRERTLIVGVDFGTSSTKVIWQDLSDSHFEVFPWNATAQGLAALLLPSTVVIRNDSMPFGLSESDAWDGDIR